MTRSKNVYITGLFYLMINIPASFSQYPDLQCSYFWWNSNTATEKNPFWISVKMYNAGMASADSSHVCAYLSTDDDWDISDDHFVGKQPVHSLSPGEYDSVQWNFIFPDLGSGNYQVWILAIADYDHEIAESDENNNWKCNKSFNVNEPPEINSNTGLVDIYEISDKYESEITDDLINKEKTFAWFSGLAEDMTGLTIPEPIENYDYSCNRHRSDTINAFPDTVGWSIFDSPVKDQTINMCRSCWAFAAVALIENISRHKDLSEQAVISCAVNSNCDGGWTGEALEYIHETGVPVEKCYPYIGMKGNCSDVITEQEYIVKVSEYDYYPRWSEPTSSTVDDLKVLLQNGPVIVSMDIPEDNSFKGKSGYQGGIYDYQGGIITDCKKHAVLVVGYNDNEKFFRAKNSWGPAWGENGYFRIAYNDVTDNTHFGGYACTASRAYTKREGDEFILSNTGGSTLEIDTIRTDKKWLSFNPVSIPALNIPPGDSLTIDCVIDWDGVPGLSDTAMVIINSNDPDDPVSGIKVIAFPCKDNCPVGTLNKAYQEYSHAAETGYGLMIYPNPASDIINIEISNTGEGETIIELLTVSGQVIYSKEYKNSNAPFVKQIDLSGYVRGMYFVKVRQSDLVYNGKIIIQ